MRKSLLTAIAWCVASIACATEGVSEMATSLFGEAKGERITTGVVFVDGLYLKAPYVVEREGNALIINGRIASRFKVQSATEKPSPALQDAIKKAAKGDPAAGSSGSENYVADKDGATIGGDEMPELTDNKSSTAAAPEAPKGSAIEARLAAQKKSKDMKDKAKTGSFNTASSNNDPMALFEEADYTYTPPRQPEPKPIPYIRPAAEKTMKEKLAVAKEKELDQAAKQAAAAKDTEDDEEDDSDATEDFDNLTEEEIKDFTAKFEKARVTVEKALKADGMVFLSSGSAGRKAYKRTTMRKFVNELPTYFKQASADVMIKRNPSMPRTYLKRIFDNRTANANDMKVISSRVKREAAAAAKKAAGPIR